MTPRVCGPALRRVPAAGMSPADNPVEPLDTASLASVRAGAEEIRAIAPRLDLLINNAGVMQVPYARTEDGLELFGEHLPPVAPRSLVRQLRGGLTFVREHVDEIV